LETSQKDNKKEKKSGTSNMIENEKIEGTYSLPQCFELLRADMCNERGVMGFGQNTSVI